MENLEKYSLVDLINKYKDIIEDEIESVIISSIMPINRIDLINEFRVSIQNAVNSARRIIPTEFPKEKSREITLNAIYNRIIFMLETAEFDNIEIAKKDFLMETYRRFSDKMPEKQKRELIDLILGKEDNVIYSFYSDEYPGVIDSQIISRKKPKKLSDIKDQEEKEILETALEQAEIDGYIKALLKKEYHDVYNKMINKMAANLIKKGEMTLEEYEIMFKSDETFYDEKIYEKIEGKLNREEDGFFKDNLQFIDEEFLVLNLAARIMLGLKLGKGENIERAWLNEEIATRSKEGKEIAMKQSISILKRVNIYLNSPRFKDEEFVISNDKNEIVIVGSLKTIREFLDRCTEYDYLNDEDIENIHKDLLEGKLVENPDERRIASINKEDLFEMLKANKEDKENILPVAIELIEYLRQTEKINDEEILESYLDAKLPLELITEIEMEGLSEEELSQKLKETYFETFVKDNEEEKKEKLKKAARLAKLINLYDEFDKDNVIVEISYLFEGEDDNTKITNLKRIGLIDLEKAIDYAGIDVLLSEYSEGNLKPVEVRRLYDDCKIDLDDLARLIKKLPDNSEKFMIIGSIFPDKQDAEIREILALECMNLENGIKKSRKGSKRNKPDEPRPNNYNEYTTDPFARLSLIQILDKDYSFEMTSDGHAIIKLPNFGKVVIEKMLDKDGNFSYGSATYILSEDYYDRNHINIIEDGRINRSRIIEDVGLGEVYKIIHGVHSWGKNIKKHFKTDDKTRYSDEDREKIEESIKRVEESHKLRE